MTLIRCIDFETSDLPENGGIVIEAGRTDISIREDGQVSLFGPHAMLYSLPEGTLIVPSARAAHNIRDEDLKGFWEFDRNDAEVLIRAPEYPDQKVPILCAHNAEFETAMLSNYIGARSLPPFICTMKVAAKIYPEEESYSLQYLRYKLILGNNAHDHSLGLPVHRAGPDSYVGALLLGHFLNMGVSISDLLRITREPRHYGVCPIGKFKGKRWSEVESGYLIWMTTKAQDMEKEIRDAAQNELNLRRKT